MKKSLAKNIGFTLLFLLIISFTIYLFLSGQIKNETVNLEKVLRTDSIKFKTTSGINLTLDPSRDIRIEEKLLESIEANKSLYFNASVTYKSRLGGILNNILNITLVNGEVFIVNEDSNYV